MKNFIQIDLFGLSVFLETEVGKQIIYTIEQIDGLYKCFVQKRTSKKARWSKKRLVDSSNTHLSFEYANSDLGFNLKRN